MSMHIEWTSPAEPAELIEDVESWSDDYGQTIDAGKVGLFVGNSGGGTVVEGTRSELAAWLGKALELVSS